ncbi:MAG: ABC transporter ATP-binding protein [Lachnospiraceae bacterium]|nr:ABC transporter ATP-binding protein [Lachnospiraceae bacterium]
MIKFEKVTKIYREGFREHIIFQNMSIELNDAESVAVVGPSGTGKSTFLNLIAGLTDWDSGKIFIDDIDIQEMKNSKKAKMRLGKYGFIFQHYNLVSSLNGIDNILVPALAKSKKPDMDYIMGIVKEFETESLMYKYPRQLSGGEQQRIAIVRALVNRPQIILADEATGNLDADNSKKVMDMLSKCHKEYGNIFIFVTHDEELCKYADRIVRIKKGGVISDERQENQYNNK